MNEAVLDEVPPKALAIFADPDDPDISCGGTIARWAAAGSEVDVVICTSGDKGTMDPETNPHALAAVRVAEAERSAKVLGVSGLHFLGGYSRR